MGELTKRKVLLSAALLFLAAALAACGSVVEVPPKPSSFPSAPSAPPDRSASLRLVVAGDNLIHDTIYLQAKAAAERAGKAGYDFSAVYADVAPLIQSADLCYINQETLPICPPFEPSNYPLFASPTEVVDELRAIGFNLFGNANNHSFDKGQKGMAAALDFYDSRPDVLQSGMYRDRESFEDIPIVEKNGLKVALLAFTQHTNGLRNPGSGPFVILATEQELIERLVKKARAEADVVLVAVHWGVEGSFKPNSYQEQLSDRLIAWGADIILGSHPHVLQPMAYKTAPDGRKCLVIYSLADFVCAERQPSHMPSGLMDIELYREDEESPVEIREASFIPTVIHCDAGRANIRVIPWADYTPELAAAHGLHRADAPFDYDTFRNIFKTTIPPEFLKGAVE